MKNLESVLELINEYKGFNEIKEELSLSKYELNTLFYKIVNRRVTVRLPWDVELFARQQHIENISFVNLKESRVIIIADTHLGCINENIAYLEMVDEFIRQEKIKILFHAGDIGDGIYKPKEQYSTCSAQIDHILDVYPSRDGLEQYVLAGNHDLVYRNHDFRILKILEKEKKNLTGVGYFQSYFKVYDKIISFEHDSKKWDNFIKPDFSIRGHSHQAKLLKKRVNIPTLSDDHPHTIADHPGFMVLETSKYGNSVILNFDHYIMLDDSIKKSNEKRYVLK